MTSTQLTDAPEAAQAASSPSADCTPSARDALDPASGGTPTVRARAAWTSNMLFRASKETSGTHQNQTPPRPPPRVTTIRTPRTMDPPRLTDGQRSLPRLRLALLPPGHGRLPRLLKQLSIYAARSLRNLSARPPRVCFICTAHASTCLSSSPAPALAAPPGRAGSRGHAQSDSEADLLPKVNGVPSRNIHGGVWFTRRYTKLAVAFLVGLALFLAVIALGAHWKWRRAPVVAALLAEPERMPPDYARFHEYELQTSERHGDYADTKYIFFANHARNSGWGNVMQELLLQALLAYRMKRTFVYYNYTWRDDGSTISYYNGKPIPSTIPLSALMQGPILGTPSVTDPSAAHPFAVTEDYYYRVCPENERKYIRTEEVSSLLRTTSTAGNMIEKWVEVFGELPAKCIEIPSDAPSNFDIFIFGDASRLLDVWPIFSKSPILQEFAWSPLVELAFDQNREVFAPTYVYVPPLGTLPMALSGSTAVSPSAARYAPIPGLLAIHLRRGDFSEHCTNLARWGSSYVGHNEFPELPDKFHYPPDTNDDDRSRARQAGTLE
ncbi:hypothetical protein EVJ58_g8818 [Rhodofomes roseus]|uniref:Uncharacterized protein n=1 Tax=Rhodofomes roseus TaxID=34475 RepID=A0A4Y9XXY0_9APHY|nr:hypothetical protein EVJ58_g8818 [Rhodofomes roseus]